ncbi:hypothetical protein ACEPAG_4011 [Sanghuangporus baumii]
MENKYNVSYIHSRPVYALYLSERNNETVAIDLRADAPLEPAPGVGINESWIASGVKEIKTRRGRRCQSPDPLNDDKEDLVPIEVPWNILDDDGKDMVDLSVSETSFRQYLLLMYDDSDLEVERYL